MATLHPGLTGGQIDPLATAHAGLALGPGSAATQVEGAAAVRATENMCREPRRRPPQGSHRRGHGSGAGVGAWQTGRLALAPNGAACGLPPQVVLRYRRPSQGCYGRRGGGWLWADTDAVAEDGGGGAPSCRNQAWPSAAVGLRARCTTATRALCCDGRVRASVVAGMLSRNVMGSFAVLMSVKVDMGRASSDGTTAAACAQLLKPRCAACVMASPRVLRVARCLASRSCPPYLSFTFCTNCSSSFAGRGREPGGHASQIDLAPTTSAAVVEMAPRLVVMRAGRPYGRANNASAEKSVAAW